MDNQFPVDRAPAQNLAHRQTGLKTNLVLLVIAALVPIGLLAAAVLFLLWQNAQNAQDASQFQTVRELAAGIDAEIDSTINRLALLANDTLLKPDTLAEFYERAKGILQESSDWLNISLADSNAEQIFNLNLAFGTRLPTLKGLSHIETALTTKRPLVSDLFQGRTSGRKVVVVTVPVVRQGEMVYLLIATLNPSYFKDRFASKSLDPDGIITIFDTQFRAVARSRNPDKYVGELPGESLYQAMQQRPEGSGRFLPRDGPSVNTAWTKTQYGWFVAFSRPSAPADAALARYMIILAIAWLVMMSVGFVFAMLLARRIDQGISYAVRSAEALANGLEAQLPKSNIRELNALSDALRFLVGKEHAARASAELANKAKDEFLAMLGHELRNPIGAISNAIRVIQMPGVSNKDLQFTSGVIARQTDHLRHLIDDLLDVGRVLTGKIELERKPIDLAQCAKDVLTTLDTSGKTKAHKITLDATPVWVDADPTRIEQVLSNLVLNAVTYTPEGGSVHILVKQDGHEAVVEVTDTGVGLDAETLPRVFELFFQAERGPYRARTGLGIGLTLVQRLTALHGGTVSAHSAGPGEGSTFTLRVPTLQRNPSEQPAAEVTVHTKPCTVVLVEDEVDSRETLKLALEKEGHRVYETGDGSQVLSMIKRVAPDVALIDIGLPGMNGYDVARCVRAEFARRVTLIAITGYGLPEDERKANEAGFDAHLVKPVDFARLNALIDTYCK